MKQTQLFTKTRREDPKDETSINAKLLIKGGFIHKEMAGVYSFLPLGLIVLNKIINIIREEMQNIGAEEVWLSSLQDPEIWKKTNRWDETVVDSWLKTKISGGAEVGLALTHEEPLTRLLKSHINSYKDLPKYIFQFQTKFRNEVRAQGGLLRTREFLMKDMYSFNINTAEQDDFYENKAISAYKNIFARVGLGDKTYLTFASGGIFAKYSHEFQTVCEAGEDTIFISAEKKIAINKEVLNLESLKEVFSEPDMSNESYETHKANLIQEKAVEVGNIFRFGSKYSKPLGLTFKDSTGKEMEVLGGSYGIGVPRLMGVVCEIYNDKNGIIWPESIAPFKYHILCDTNHKEAVYQSNLLYDNLKSNGVSVLLDDREETIPTKIYDADLIGCPYRVIVSPRSLSTGGVELKNRKETKGRIVSLQSIVK